MTREASRPSQSGHQGDGERDIFARLWEQSDFPRLPEDAPPELKDYVVEIENPRRVYAIYRASRRHNFQLLVEMYITQLRSGCGSDTCATPTCFSCRKRIVGKAPIKRYNITSARTLAIYLASQDNPENGLCPKLRPPNPKEAPAALNSLLFTPKHPTTSSPKPVSAPRKLGGQSGVVSPTAKPVVEGKPSHGRSSPTPRPTHTSDGLKWIGPEEMPEHRRVYPPHEQPEFTASERPISKDYRSFAANVFNTVAFKMVEWLTPTALESLSRKTAEMQDRGAPKAHPIPPLSDSELKDLPIPETPTPSRSSGVSPSLGGNEPAKEILKDIMERPQDRAPSIPLPQDIPASASRPPRTRKNSNARVRAPSTSKPNKRKVSIDPFTPPPASEDVVPGLTSPRLSGMSPPKPSQARGPRSIPEIPATPGFFDHVKAVPPSRAEIKTINERELGVEEPKQAEKKEAAPQPDSVPEKKPDSKPRDEKRPHELPSSQESIHDSLLPQSLSRLNPEIIDLLCDITRDNGTFEIRQFEPEMNHPFDHLLARPGYLERVRSPKPYPHRLVLEWKLFVEQSLFTVLTDPAALVASFSRDGELFDSQSLWYCLMRMVKVAPSLVFDSLWLAAGALFVPPSPLQALRSPTMRAFRRSGRALTGAEAGRLMAICLHALVAAGPLATNAQEMQGVSRIRSGGRIIDGTGAGGIQPSWVALRFEDAFANELCVRLARRLFMAVVARRRFAEMVERDDSGGGDKAEELDVLQPVLAQMEALGNVRRPVLHFPPRVRTGHQTRVPVLILDWAWTVMFDEWNGGAEFPANGPFAGAISLVAAMHEMRESLALDDVRFWIDYIGDRLDSVDMPVEWLNFTPSRETHHLLDYPYLFKPDTLITYFRSINFARMSRAYEESSSLQTRMNAIVAPESLITDPHHKTVLQRLLRTASCRYLILDISRQNVIRDAFDQLWHREERELLRPLKVHFGETEGEEGLDSGGVQQEFMRLAVAECLDPNYGAFTIDSRTQMAWFVPGSVVEPWKFELVGLLMSIAIYNGLTMPVTFPKALYRKLLGEPVDRVEHIADGWPDLASGLTELLDWDEATRGSVEDVFVRTYEFSVEAFGQNISREMKAASPQWPQFSASPAGDAAAAAADNPTDAEMVTGENRAAYVRDYVGYLTDASVRPQYEAFARGFRRCLHAKSLRLLTPELLQGAAEGVQEIDVAELRRHARYVGWDPTHRSVRDFWSVVKRYDLAMRRRLLEFVTASDRVPVGGMKNLVFVLQKNGEAGRGGHLPTAYTCYGTLLMPEYQDKEILRERLGMALQNSQGFGFA